MYKSIIIWLRNCFGFSRTESNAYLVLTTLLLGIHLYLSRFHRESISPEPPYIDSLVMQLSGVQDTVKIKRTKFSIFDPNAIPYDSLLKMGMPRFIASNMIKYREAGGSFGSAEDLRLLYGMTDSLWLEIKPWISFGTNTELTDFPAFAEGTGPKNSRSRVLMDLNKVDSAWLMSINGIGKVLSSRIIKYRNLLGGFHSMEQLKEVYHLPEDAIEALLQQVFIDVEKAPLEKIKINQMDYLQMASHPYLTFSQARSIVSYRSQHGAFKNLEDLKKIHLMDDSTYLRVLPYLDF
jgi:DNA uptake protein ComE-like DNA-binding protein